MKFHPATFFAGLIFLVVSVVFTLEALGVWTVRLADLRLIGPLALVLIGLGVIGGSLTRRET